jgi:hypothetical protein
VRWLDDRRLFSLMNEQGTAAELGVVALGGRARTLAKHEGLEPAAWSSDGRRIAYVERTGESRAEVVTRSTSGTGRRVVLRTSIVGELTVEDAKTDAGRRTVDVSPWLLDELKAHRASADYADPSDYVFATRNGTKRERSNITRQILRPAIEAANEARAKAGLPPIASGVTNHSLRRTFASLLYEAGASPAYVMAQMGHTSPALALAIYAQRLERTRDTGERMDALVRGADWAQTGTSAVESSESVAA